MAGFLERGNELPCYIKKTGIFLFTNKRPSVSEEGLYCRKFYIYIYIYMCVCVCVCIYIYIYIYIYTHCLLDTEHRVSSIPVAY